MCVRHVLWRSYYTGWRLRNGDGRPSFLTIFFPVAFCRHPVRFCVYDERDMAFVRDFTFPDESSNRPQRKKKEKGNGEEKIPRFRRRINRICRSFVALLFSKIERFIVYNITYNITLHRIIVSVEQAKILI